METTYSVHGVRHSGQRTPDEGFTNMEKAKKQARILVNGEACENSWVMRWINGECRQVYCYGHIKGIRIK